MADLCFPLQGAGMLGAGNIRDLWMPATCLVLLTASIIYALVDLSNQVKTQPKAQPAVVVDLVWPASGGSPSPVPADQLHLLRQRRIL